MTLQIIWVMSMVAWLLTLSIGFLTNDPRLYWVSLAFATVSVVVSVAGV